MDLQWRLHERFIQITELLARERSYVEREAAVYALATLADDCMELHDGELDKCQSIQQACLNLISSQLRDPIDDEDPDPELLLFKHRVQQVIADRYRPKHSGDIPVWTHLLLDLTYCHVHNLSLAYAEFLVAPVNFSHAHFHGDTSFSFAEFHVPVKFTRAHFYNTASFDSVMFRYLARFTGAQFHGLAWFSDTRMGGQSYFDRAYFGGPASFRRVDCENDVEFSAAHFDGRVHFSDATFNGEADFSEAQFNDATCFDSITFIDTAYFPDVFFGGDTTFHKSEFIGDACFAGAVFSTTPKLLSTLFNKVDFSGAHFHCPMFFGPYQFCAEVDFSGAWFCSAFDVHEDQGSQVDFIFHGTHFGHDDDTVFRDLNSKIPGALLEDATFSDSCGSRVGVHG